ncbi:50S ribosomal protein L22 [Patescibacteria group bacterium]|jgi:large subunit ribosomal protein L22|nr:50S ribosomal protein L22 [Patescibacteria group bacterium]
MKAFVKNYRQSPRKVRLLADLVRGKQVTKAVTLLEFSEKRAGGAFSKALRSAIANARVQGKNEETLFVTKVAVDMGQTLKRFMPRARGSASAIRKHSSHIAIELGEKALKKVSK